MKKFAKWFSTFAIFRRNTVKFCYSQKSQVQISKTKWFFLSTEFFFQMNFWRSDNSFVKNGQLLCVFEIWLKFPHTTPTEVLPSQTLSTSTFLTVLKKSIAKFYRVFFTLVITNQELPAKGGQKRLRRLCLVSLHPLPPWETTSWVSTSRPQTSQKTRCPSLALQRSYRGRVRLPSPKLRRSKSGGFCREQRPRDPRRSDWNLLGLHERKGFHIHIIQNLRTLNFQFIRGEKQHLFLNIERKFFSEKTETS